MNEFDVEKHAEYIATQVSGESKICMKSISVDKADRTLKYLARNQKKIRDQVNEKIKKYNKFVDDMEWFIGHRIVTYQCVNCGDIVSYNLLFYLKDEKIWELCNKKVCRQCWHNEVSWMTETALKDKIYGADKVEIGRIGNDVTVNIDGLTLYVPVKEIELR